MLTIHRRTATAVLVTVVVAGAAGCSSSTTASTDAGATGAAAPRTTAPATEATDTASAAAQSTQDAASSALTVEALDHSYQVTGTPHAGLVDITFDNKGEYAHEMAVSRLKPGVTLDRIKAALSDPDGQQAAMALIDDPEAEYPMPAIVGPGMSVEVASTLPAGHYVLTCFLPGPDGMPHIAMGMIDEFTVDESPSTATPPSILAPVLLTDTGIELPANFPSGGTFAVKNTGTAPHDFSVAQL